MPDTNLITMITDFGLEDPYVGVMKGVILSINPSARIVDITHSITPGDILGASCVLKESLSYFPTGSVHMVVVDPGVGSLRRPIAVITENYVFVGPDNGVLWPAIKMDGARIIHLNEKRYFLKNISRTFHGRDIFAPVCAYISKGTSPDKMGTEIKDPVMPHIPVPSVEGDKLIGHIIRVDRFGNIITNIRQEELMGFLKGKSPVIMVGDLIIEGLKNTYSDVPEGQELALIGSSGFLELSINSGNALDRAGIKKDKIKDVRIIISHKS